MAKMPNSIIFFLLLGVIGSFNFFPAAADQELDTYIIHLSLPDGIKSYQSLEREEWYRSILSKITQEESRMMHKYHKVMTGFAARLTPEEAEMLREIEEVAHFRPQKTYKLATTHSANFLGLQINSGPWSVSNYGKRVIIGVLDSGITPGHPSFSDLDMPPPPAKWKGKCELDGTACNNKLIGARNLVQNISGPPIDLIGHGTHCASIAAGNFVEDVNLFEEARGTAAGMAPHAHLAIYKVCRDENCTDTDILAGMDAAINDGVDVISISLASDASLYYSDSIAVSSFVAMQHGIFVSTVASNSGPLPATLANEAPWLLTVGASTIDREIRATALLGNGEEFDGECLFQPMDFPSTQFPLVYLNNSYNQNASFCAPGSLDNIDVKGKIVLCQRGDDTPRTTKGQTVKDAGGAGMIFMNDETNAYSTLADPHVLPATHISYEAGQKIKYYISSTSTPTATISFKGTTLGVQSAPSVASFSSRGPTRYSPGILKPDIIGPGVSILAAWPVSVENNNSTKSTFAMESGTSMACPHLSGIAALIKSTHPDWSPAAIKSAMMTSANQFSNSSRYPILDEKRFPADVFAKGAGNVNPTNAMDPGLIYDIQPFDYIRYVCSLGYNDTEVSVVIQHPFVCSTTKAISGAELNYPSFSIDLYFNESVTYSRTVTNVGEAESSYTVSIDDVKCVSIDVNPPTLTFTQVNKNMTYAVTFARSSSCESNGTYVEGAIAWYSEKYYVRSPISVNLI